MKILPVTNIEKGNNLSFKRKPNAKQIKFYEGAIKEGLALLDKDLGFIIHNSSVPSAKTQNLGIGSLLSEATNKSFVPFLILHGIKSIQQEPIYLRRETDPSPYNPLSVAKNIYMIPLEKLASEEYGFLIKPDFLNSLITTNDEKVDYKKIIKKYNLALTHAYSNFYTHDYDKNLQEKLQESFAIFSIKNHKELEQNALYEIFTKLHKEDDWTKWPDEDKYLYAVPEGTNRLAELRKKYAKDIDFHIFKQWLVETEIANTNKLNQELGIKIVADTPVAFAPAEVWTNQDLFLKDIVLGCPPDYFSKDGQRWDFPVLDPKKIFNPDGTLGEGGIFLKMRYEAIFQASPGGVRIDHLIGLIDPFVYTKNEPMTNANSGRMYSVLNNEKFNQYTKFTDDEFGAIIEKIIFPAAEKYGIARENIICEDLGEQTPPVKRILEKLNLTGLSVTQFGYSGADTPKRNVIMLGAHDNQSYIEFTNDLFAKSNNLDGGKDRFIYKTHILGSDTVTPRENVHQYRELLRSSKAKFMMASFTELFTSPAKKVQIFFTDFFGIGKTYNTPGSKKDCWTLRLPSNYEEIYYKNLQKGLGINLPEVLARAIRQKGEEFSSKHSVLLRKLDFFTRILKN